MAQTLYKLVYTGPKVQKKMDYPIECLFAPNKEDPRDDRPHAVVTIEHGQALIGRFPDAFNWDEKGGPKASNMAGAGGGGDTGGVDSGLADKLLKGFDMLTEGLADLKVRLTKLEDEHQALADDFYVDDAGDGTAPDPDADIKPAEEKPAESKTAKGKAAEGK